MAHRDYGTISVVNINGHFAAIALEKNNQLLACSHKITGSNFALIDVWVTNQPHVSWVNPLAGTTEMLKLGVPITSRKFSVDLLQRTSFVMTPGDDFDGEGYVHIG